MSSRGERLLALDVFRGMTVAGMLLVNNPGSWATIYPPLEHAKWHGWTPTDLIFPFFLFIVGITTDMGIRRRSELGATTGELIAQITRRGVIIVLLGLMVSAFPFFTWTTVPGNPDPSLVDRVIHRFENIRLTGVLQRIGVAYFFAALLTLRTTRLVQVGIVVAMLVGYWILMTLVPVPDSGIQGRYLLDAPDRVLSAWIDRTVLGTKHLWVGSRTWDPEGLLSTIPAIGTVMLGSFAGAWLARKDRTLEERLSALFSVGLLVMVAGSMWHWAFPINKNLWTSSYVLFTGGMAAVALGVCLWVIDVLQWRRWTEPFVVYGINPMLAFVGSSMMARLTVSVLQVTRSDGRRTSLQSAVYDTVYSSWLPAHAASFAYALSFVFFWYVVLRIARYRGIVFKV